MNTIRHPLFKQLSDSRLIVLFTTPKHSFIAMRHLSVLPLVILFVVFTQASHAQKKLAIVGSSTSACVGPTDANNCYVARLRTYFNKESPYDTSVDNGYAVSGYNCYRGMPSTYIPPYSWANLQPDPLHDITAAIASHPDVILVNYPTNGYDSLRIDSVLFCLRTIRNAAIKAGIPCFVTTTQPRTIFTTAARAKLKELRDSIILEMGFFAINFWDGIADPVDNSILPVYAATDGIHLNDAGHAVLAQRVTAKNIFLNAQAALPVSFLQFNTIVKNNTDIITWTTANETDVAYFEIQRSADGTVFSKIGSVTAANSAGTHQYQYTDDQPLKEWNYYKILTVDKDGKKQASPVMKVLTNPGRLAILKAFARSSSQLIIELQNKDPQNAQLQIFNHMGMLVSTAAKKIEAGSSTFYLNTSMLSSGVYHIRVITPAESAVSSFIIN